MKIETHRRGVVVVLSPFGRLDGAGAPVLEAKLKAVASCGNRTVLDCRGIAYISSAGLRAILIGAKACLQEGRELAIAALRPGCRTVMDTTGLLSVLNYHPSVEAALDGSARTRSPEGGGSMEIAERHEGPVAVLGLAGQLDGAGASVLVARISDAIERGTTCLLMDCEGLTYINSTGLRAILIGAKACGHAGGKFGVAALRPQCRSVMEMSGFLSVIDYWETCEAALDALA